MSLLIGKAADLQKALVREYNSYRTRAADALLFLTYRCTSRCKTCNIWKRAAGTGEELAWDQWERVLSRLKEYDIKSVEIFGGDALLRKDVIFRMIEYCTRHDIETYFPTNSILLDNETAGNLVSAGLGTLYFSLDDVGSDSDRIRGVSDSFDRIKEALEQIIQARGSSPTPRIIICTTISKMNYSHFDRIVDFLKDYPVDAIYPRVLGEFNLNDIEDSAVQGIKPEPFFVSTEEESHRLSATELEDFRMLAKRLTQGRHNPYINLGAFYATQPSIPIRGYGHIERCLWCSTVITVNPNGDVLPCLFFKDYVLGNLVEADLEGMWGNSKHEEFIRHQRRKKIRICGSCISHVYYSSLRKTILSDSKKLIDSLL